MIDSLDGALDKLTGGDELRAAREVWGRMRRMERVEAVVERAGNAGSDGRGFEAALANGFRSLLDGPRRGFSEAELAAMRQVGNGEGAAARALGGLGKLLRLSSISGVAGAVGAASQVRPAGAS